MPEVLDYRGRPRSGTVNDEPSKTIQSDADAADITKILARYKEVGIVEHLNMAQAAYMDVTEFTDFADAVRQSKMAEIEFLKLPSKVRRIFNHDVAEWLDTAHDPEKRDALVEAGFIKAPEPEVVPAAAVVEQEPPVLEEKVVE